MILIYIQSLQIGKKVAIPFRITIGSTTDESLRSSFLIRPELPIAKKIYESHHLDRLELLSAPPFCDIADALIDLFRDGTLVFFDRKQFLILKSQFRTIGYNFNTVPKILWHGDHGEFRDGFDSSVLNMHGTHLNSARYGELFVEFMQTLGVQKNQAKLMPKPDNINRTDFNLSTYKSVAGVYFFLDASNNVLYVGKAKNLKKRLQCHFSNSTDAGNIDYEKVCSITVDYTGNDIIAQLVESENIKLLKPIYNTQQVTDSAPFVINRSKTAIGIHRLKITRKDIKDNLPEKHFNRLSVKQTLEVFCTTYRLCRKYCGLETVKGPCSNNTIRHQQCVCAGNEPIALYNDRFDSAFYNFQNKKTRKVFKLKGRSDEEDAFIYTVNGIYEGYGYIHKDDTILTENDILGNLISVVSNYDTSRIISGLSKKIAKENVLVLESLF